MWENSWILTSVLSTTRNISTYLGVLKLFIFWEDVSTVKINVFYMHKWVLLKYRYPSAGLQGGDNRRFIKGEGVSLLSQTFVFIDHMIAIIVITHGFNHIHLLLQSHWTSTNTKHQQTLHRLLTIINDWLIIEMPWYLIPEQIPTLTEESSTSSMWPW